LVVAQTWANRVRLGLPPPGAASIRSRASPAVRSPGEGRPLCARPTFLPIRRAGGRNGPRVFIQLYLNCRASVNWAAAPVPLVKGDAMEAVDWGAYSSFHLWRANLPGLKQAA